MRRAPTELEKAVVALLSAAITRGILELVAWHQRRRAVAENSASFYAEGGLITGPITPGTSSSYMRDGYGPTQRTRDEEFRARYGAGHPEAN